MAVLSRPLRILLRVRPYHTGPTRTFATRFAEWMNPEKFQLIICCEANGPACEWFGQRPGVEVVLAERDSPLLETLLQETDVAHTDGFDFELARAAHRIGVPHVCSIGASPEDGMRDYRPEWRRPSLTAVTMLAQQVICRSEFLASPFREVGATNVQVFYNGVDLQRFAPAPLFARREATVGMVAHFLPQKRHEDFLRAAAAVQAARPGVRFLIAGTVYDRADSREYHEHLVSLSRELGARVEFTLFSQPERDLAELDIMVLPSQDEGCSNAILETMAVGRPVVATRSGGNPELVTEECGCLFPVGDVPELTGRLIELLEDREKVAAMGQGARLRVERNFELGSKMAQYGDLYASLCRGGEPVAEQA